MTILINLDFLKLNAIPIVALISFAGGLYVSHLYHTAIEDHQAKDLLKQVQKQKDIDIKTITELQVDNATLQNKYITLGEKLHETKLTTTPCIITTDGIKLWNQSGSSETSLPTITKGSNEATNASSGIDLTKLYENKLVNDNICNGMRQQLEAIIQWNKDTYGN